MNVYVIPSIFLEPNQYRQNAKDGILTDAELLNNNPLKNHVRWLLVQHNESKSDKIDIDCQPKGWVDNDTHAVIL